MPIILNKAIAKKLGFAKDKPSKLKNQKTKIDSLSFDSKKEANRYCELKLLEKIGRIKNLRLQVPFELIPKQLDKGGKVLEKAVIYKADFVYERDGKTVVEDTKGFKTKDYIIKRKLMLFRYGIRVMEI